MRRCLCLLACGLVSASAPSLWAQDEFSAGPGSRVRIKLAPSRAPEGRVALLSGVVGTLVRVDDETLTLQVDGTAQTLGIARRSILRFEVSAGRRSRMKNALVGAGVGLGAGGLLLIAYFGSDALSNGGDLATSTLMMGTLTVPVFALAGALLPTPERWKQLPLDRIRVSVAPVRGRGVAVSLRFGF